MSDLICKTVWKLRFKHIPEIYNSARCFSSRPLPRQAGATTTGLYGFDHLKSPKGFQRFVDEAIERSGELVGAISSTSSSAEIVRAMDEISDTVCSVVDSAELCRNTHPDRFTESSSGRATSIYPLKFGKS
uniref:Putative mitochondrial intermediate peptidase isoform X3 n=1 Tax=Rhizophora mucronata TaxID=61149 RepID=A0A2P2M062_RHIMU